MTEKLQTFVIYPTLLMLLTATFSIYAFTDMATP